MALRATRPGAGAPPAKNTGAGAPAIQQQEPAPQQQSPAIQSTPNVPAVQGANALAPKANPGVLQDLNAGILDNIDNLGNSGNFVTMDGTDFLFKATEERAKEIDIQVCYGKRYYQWVEEDGESKIFHDSDTKLDDRYKLKFEIHWKEEDEEGAETEYQFHMPTASAMRFIDYVKELAKAGYGIGQVVTRVSISRQVQKNSTNRYSRAEFTMVGMIDANGEVIETANGITTVGKK